MRSSPSYSLAQGFDAHVAVCVDWTETFAAADAGADFQLVCPTKLRRQMWHAVVVRRAMTVHQVHHEPAVPATVAFVPPQSKRDA